MKYVCKYSFGIHSHFSGKNPVSGSQAHRDPISAWALIDRDPALTSNGDLDSYPIWQTGMGSCSDSVTLILYLHHIYYLFSARKKQTEKLRKLSKLKADSIETASVEDDGKEILYFLLVPTQNNKKIHYYLIFIVWVCFKTRVSCIDRKKNNYFLIQFDIYIQLYFSVNC